MESDTDLVGSPRVRMLAHAAANRPSGARTSRHDERYADSCRSQGTMKGAILCSAPVKRGAIALIAVCAVLSSAQAIAEKTAVVKPNRIEIAYVEPKNPAHQKIYEVLKQRRVLERFQAYLSALRLPRTLTLKTDGCDGESNAWYEETDHTVTVCYEYIDDVVRNAPDMTTAAGVTPRDAVVGPTVEVFLHEVGHAIFNLLKVPILGREEDAADHVADYLILDPASGRRHRTASSGRGGLHVRARHEGADARAGAIRQRSWHLRTAFLQPLMHGLRQGSEIVRGRHGKRLPAGVTR